jgi:hypothetical protein
MNKKVIKKSKTVPDWITLDQGRVNEVNMRSFGEYLLSLNIVCSQLMVYVTNFLKK